MNSPTFILVETQLPQNLGATARAMKNFGLSSMVLVNPLADPLSKEAAAMAAGTEDILNQAIIFKTFEEAISPFQDVVATTACPRDMITTYKTPRHWAEEGAAKPALKRALVFGPERTGLTNDHIALCHGVVSIPVNTNFSSLNISQAALVLAYEFFLAGAGRDWPASETQMGETEPATHEELAYFLNDLEERLDKANFWRVPSKKPVMLRNIQSLFSRIPLGSQEIRTLRGILGTINKTNE